MDLTQVLSTVIEAIIVILAGLLLALARRYLSQQQIAIARTVAETAVGAVEQLAASGVIDPRSKLERAMVRARDLATQHGIVLTDDQWRTLLEGAVKAMKQASAELDTGTRPVAVLPPHG
jgi:D-serine dehydratase